MDFDQRLERAVERGRRRGARRAEEEAQRAMNEEECKRLHSQHRLELSDYIAECLKRLPDHFPGFRVEPVHGDRGWGAAVSRDDVNPRPVAGGRSSVFSRLEMTVAPYSQYRVLDLSARGTIRNKEVFNRNHYQRLEDVDFDSFRELIDLWVLEYAELYAAG